MERSPRGIMRALATIVVFSSVVPSVVPSLFSASELEGSESTKATQATGPRSCPPKDAQHQTTGGEIENRSGPGPGMTYFIIDYGTQTVSEVEQAIILRVWTTRDQQSAMAIDATIRTYGAGEYSPNNFGSEYDLAGLWTGIDYPNQSPVTGFVADGTTDGIRYNWATATEMDAIYRFDRNWENPTLAFSVSSPTGITYHPDTGNLWVINGANQQVEEYTQSGSLVSSFPYDADMMGALAYDAAYELLWATDLSDPPFGDILGYTTSGILQREWTLSLVGGGPPFGGECRPQHIQDALFVDGFEAGDTSAWSIDIGAK